MAPGTGHQGFWDCGVGGVQLLSLAVVSQAPSSQQGLLSWNQDGDRVLPVITPVFLIAINIEEQSPPPHLSRVREHTCCSTLGRHWKRLQQGTPGLISFRTNRETANSALIPKPCSLGKGEFL